MFRFLALCAIFACASASALEIPSAASGDYRAPGATAGFTCRFDYSLASNGQRSVGLRCTTPWDAQTVALTTTNACPNDWTLSPLVEWGSSGVKQVRTQTWQAPDGALLSTTLPADAQKSTTLWVRVTGYTVAQQLVTRIGLFDELNAGGGSTLVFGYSQPYVPATPYAGCSGASTFDVCRVLGCAR